MAYIHFFDHLVSMYLLGPLDSVIRARLNPAGLRFGVARCLKVPPCFSTQRFLKSGRENEIVFLGFQSSTTITKITLNCIQINIR